MNHIKTISIPQACNQSWQQMAAVNEGRHCEHCCKTVVDFTQMSDEEIIRYISSHGKVCGRIERYQLVHINNILQAKKPVANNWGKRAVIILGLLGSISFRVSAQSKQAIVNTQGFKQNPRKAKPNLKKSAAVNRGNILEAKSSRYVPTPTLTDLNQVEPYQIRTQNSVTVILGGLIAVVDTETIYQPRMIWHRVKGLLGVHSELAIDSDDAQRSSSL